MREIGKIKGSIDSLKALNLDVSGYVKTDSYYSDTEHNWIK